MLQILAAANSNKIWLITQSDRKKQFICNVSENGRWTLRDVF